MPSTTTPSATDVFCCIIHRILYGINKASLTAICISRYTVMFMALIKLVMLQYVYHGHLLAAKKDMQQTGVLFTGTTESLFFVT